MEKKYWLNLQIKGEVIVESMGRGRTGDRATNRLSYRDSRTMPLQEDKLPSVRYLAIVKKKTDEEHS